MEAASFAAALSKKATRLGLQCQHARAAERYADAAAAVQAAGASPDSLVLAYCQMQQAEHLMAHARAAVSSFESFREARVMQRHACETLLPRVLQALSRRRDARTLLAGACLAEEEAFYAEHLRQCGGLARDACSRAGAGTPGAGDAARRAPLIGYETLLNAATLALAHAAVLAVGERGAASERVAELADFAASAADAMAQPRATLDGAWLGAEVAFAEALRKAMEGPPAAFFAPGVVITLGAAWRRVLRSGVLQRRDIGGGVWVAAQLADAADAGAAAWAPRRCALAACAAAEAAQQQFKSCAACRAVCYCCREHQVADWPSHKAACKAARDDKQQTGAGCC